MKVRIDQYDHGQNVKITFKKGIMHAYVIFPSAVDANDREGYFVFDGQNWLSVDGLIVVPRCSGYGDILYSITNELKDIELRFVYRKT